MLFWTCYSTQHLTLHHCLTGGMLWFSDLGQVALDLSVMQAPMGAVGAALPAAVALSMFANINRSFGTPANSTAGK